MPVAGSVGGSLVIVRARVFTYLREDGNVSFAECLHREWMDFQCKEDYAWMDCFRTRG